MQGLSGREVQAARVHTSNVQVRAGSDGDGGGRRDVVVRSVAQRQRAADNAGGTGEGVVGGQGQRTAAQFGNRRARAGDRAADATGRPGLMDRKGSEGFQRDAVRREVIGRVDDHTGQWIRAADRRGERHVAAAGAELKCERVRRDILINRQTDADVAVRPRSVIAVERGVALQSHSTQTADVNRPGVGAQIGTHGIVQLELSPGARAGQRDAAVPRRDAGERAGTSGHREGLHGLQIADRPLRAPVHDHGSVVRSQIGIEHPHADKPGRRDQIGSQGHVSDRQEVDQTRRRNHGRIQRQAAGVDLHAGQRRAIADVPQGNAGGARRHDERTGAVHIPAKRHQAICAAAIRIDRHADSKNDVADETHAPGNRAAVGFDDGVVQVDGFRVH